MFYDFGSENKIKNCVDLHVKNEYKYSDIAKDIIIASWLCYNYVVSISIRWLDSVRILLNQLENKWKVEEGEGVLCPA